MRNSRHHGLERFKEAANSQAWDMGPEGFVLLQCLWLSVVGQPDHPRYAFLLYLDLFSKENPK